MISLKLCRNTFIRIFIALVIISSLIVPSGFCQETEDSRIFIAGFNFYQQKDYTAAIGKMNEVLQKYPDTPLRDMALFWLSRAYFKSGNQHEAAHYMSQFSKEYPNNPLKNTVEEELLNLAARYEKGEKLPVSSTPDQIANKLVAEKAEQERIAKEKAEQQKLAALKAEEERKLAFEKAEQERIAKEKAEQQKLAALKAEEERKLALEKAEQERIAKEKTEQQKLAALKAEQERKLALEKAEQERIAKEKAEQQKLAALKAEQERKLALEKAEQERIAKEKAEQQKLAALKAEQERKLAVEKAEQERIAKEKTEQQKLAALKAEQERKLAVEKAEQERIAKEKAEQQKLAALKAEQERKLAVEKAEQERIAKEKTEQQKLAALKAEQERKLAVEKAEQERIAKEKAEQQKLAALKAEQERKLAVERAEQERIAKEKEEQQKLAALKAEDLNRLAAEKADQEHLAREKAALEKALERALKKAEQQRKTLVKAEKDREPAGQQQLAAAEAEQKRKLAVEKAEQERIAAEKASAKAEESRKIVAKQEEEQQRLATVHAEEQRLAKQKEATEQSRAEKMALREKAIAQYKSIIENYPGTKAATAAAAKLQELGIAVALPSGSAIAGQKPAEQPENAQVLRFEVAQYAGFEFNLMARPKTYEVATRISLPFEITNRGNGKDSFYLESGFPGEFNAGFASSGAPEQNINQTPVLVPGETFKGIMNLTIPAASIDGLRINYPVKAASRFMSEATQSREISMIAAAPLLRAVLKTDKIYPLPGEKITYRIAVLNVGSTAARNITLRLNFPPQMEPVDYAAAGFKQEMKAAIIHDGLRVNSGENKEFTVTFQLKDDSLANQELLCRAELINNQLKTNVAFMSNAAYVQVQRGITVRAVSEKLIIIPGQTVTMPFVVTNTGNIREKFKISSSIKGAQEATIFHDLNRDGIRQSNEPVINEIGPLESKEEAGIAVEMNTSRNASDSSEANVQVSLISEGDALRMATASALLVYSRPVLQMAMSNRDGRLKPGEVASFDLAITNYGSNLARIVELYSAWPEQLELVTTDPANSSVANGNILWKFNEVGAGEKRTIKVSFKVKPGTGAGTNIQVKNILKYEDQLGNRY